MKNQLHHRDTKSSWQLATIVVCQQLILFQTMLYNVFINCLKEEKNCSSGKCTDNINPEGRAGLNDKTAIKRDGDLGKKENL